MFAFLTKIKVWQWLILILILAGAVRFFNLTAPDMTTDDTLNSFRSIGYLDYLAAENTQSTPVSWFSEKQWWQGLSFHDHPPLNFIIQYGFFKMFGDTVLAARLPFVLAGIISAWLLFLICQKRYGQTTALISAATLAVLNYHVWISRIGYLESLVILWLLLAWYFFEKTALHKNYYWALGLALGLGLTTKYTFAFIGPVFLIYLLVYRRSEFKKLSLYLTAIPIIILLFPVGIYNVMLFITRGHFDAALSSILGQQPDDYAALTRMVGQASANFIPTLVDQLSLWSLALTIGGFILMAVQLIKRRKAIEPYFIPIGYTILAILSFVLIGAHDRFVSVLTPMIALVIGLTISKIITRVSNPKAKTTIWLLVAIYIIFEGLFSINTQTQAKPIGYDRITYAHYRPRFVGYKQLDDYLGKKVGASRPNKLMPFHEVPQIVKYQEKLFAEQTDNPSPDQTLIVFDDRIDWFATIWLFERRKLYDLQNAGSINTFLQALWKNDPKYFANLGFTKIIFIFGVNELLTDNTNNQELTNTINTLEQDLIRSNYQPFELKNPQDQIAFRIYEVDL